MWRTIYTPQNLKSSISERGEAAKEFDMLVTVEGYGVDE